MKKILCSLTFLFLCDAFINAQSGLDCSDPIPLCTPGQLEPSGFSGSGSIVTNGNLISSGNPAEFNMQGNTCSMITLPAPYHFLPQANGERWYSFEITQSGELCLSINPVNGLDNYEYVLFEVTGGVTCSDIATNTQNYIVDCDYTTSTGTNAITGFSGLIDTNTVLLPGTDPCINVTVGQKFLLYLALDNSYDANLPATGSGFTFEQNNLGAPNAASFGCSSNPSPCDSIVVQNNTTIDSMNGIVNLDFNVENQSSVEFDTVFIQVTNLILNQVETFGFNVNDTNLQAQVIDNGFYQVVITYANNADSTSGYYCGVIVADTIGSGSTNMTINESLANSIKLFPNPSSGLCFVEIDGSLVGAEVEVLNALGQNIHTFVLTSTKQAISNTKLSEGFYSVVISTKGEQKIIKKLMVVK